MNPLGHLLFRLRRSLGLIALGLFLGLSNTVWPAQTQQAKDLADDPVAEKRLMAIAAELRCLVCQNESLSASNADLAVDLRREIRSMIKANQSDQQIIDFLVERYGDFVRYKPPFKPVTWFLWLGPGLLGLLGFWVLFRHTRRSRSSAWASDHASPALSAQDVTHANRLLGITDSDAPRTGQS